MRAVWVACLLVLVGQILGLLLVSTRVAAKSATTEEANGKDGSTDCASKCTWWDCGSDCVGKSTTTMPLKDVDSCLSPCGAGQGNGMGPCNDVDHQSCCAESTEMMMVDGELQRACNCCAAPTTKKAAAPKETTTKTTTDSTAKTTTATTTATTTTATTTDRIQVVLGNGCFWERQYAYAMLEYEDVAFGPRGLYNLTSRVGYAGALSVGDDGLVCYHHSGGDQSDIYSELGHAEGVSVWLDASAAEEQFTELFYDFLASFTWSDSKGYNQRPDTGDVGPEYRSFLLLPNGTEGDAFFDIAQQLNGYLVHPLEFRKGGEEGDGGDGDDDNVVWVYDKREGYAFHTGEAYHQFHSNFFGDAYEDWYLALNEEYSDLGLVVETGCPDGTHWLRS